DSHGSNSPLWRWVRCADKQTRFRRANRRFITWSRTRPVKSTSGNTAGMLGGKRCNRHEPTLGAGSEESALRDGAVLDSDRGPFLLCSPITTYLLRAVSQLSVGTKPTANHNRSRSDRLASQECNRACPCRPPEDRVPRKHVVHEPIAWSHNAAITRSWSAGAIRNQDRS